MMKLIARESKTTMISTLRTIELAKQGKIVGKGMMAKQMSTVSRKMSSVGSTLEYVDKKFQKMQ